MESPVLRGTFRTFPLEDVVDVLSLSRRPIGLRLSDEDQEVGVIAIKAGQVLEAEDFRSRTSGADALKVLASDPGTAFVLVELPRTSEMHTATVIGKLGELVADSGTAYGNESPGSSPLPASAPTQLGEVIMSGETSDLGFDEILNVLPLSQLNVLISFTRNGAQVGALNLMSGQVLGAAAGPLRGMEAFSQLYADHGDRFEVRRVAVADTTESLGGVAKLLAEVREASSMSAAAHRKEMRSERALFMQGRFSDFPLEVLVDSLALCRQTIEVEFRRDDKILHRMLVKSGRIIAAATVSAKGAVAALAAIREDPGSRFLVFRRGGVNVGQIVATLQGLISDPETTPGSSRDSSGRIRLGPTGDPATAPRRETGAAAADFSRIEAQIRQVSADVAALRAAVNALRKDPDRARLAHLPARIAMVETKLRRGLERSRASVVKELRDGFSAAKPGRRERLLLTCIVVAQLCTLAAVAGLVVFLM